jgi:CRP-like cAMP-binding protein
MVADPLSVSLEAGSVVRVLEARELLFQQGDRTAAIYEVESRQLRLIRRTVDDHLVILHTAHRGEFFAEVSLFAKTYHCDAVAAAPSRVRIYPKTAVIAALRADPNLAQAFVARLAVQIQELRALMNCVISVRPVNGYCNIFVGGQSNKVEA